MHCPKPKKKARYPSGYNLVPQSKEIFSEQIAAQFPEIGQRQGYCGTEFHSVPPEEANYSTRSAIELEKENQISSVYECRGTPIVKSSTFFNKSPWIIPFNINNFKEDYLKELHELPFQSY